MIRLVVPTAEAMEALGGRIAGLLRAGDLVVLDGALGAGKTTLTRGLGAALGARGTIASPTFVLAREHPTASGVPLVHVDAYRLASAIELDDLDLDFANSIVVVEWGAGKLDGVADSWIEVAITRPRGTDPQPHADPPDADLPGADPREVEIRGFGPRWTEALSVFRTGDGG